MENKFEQIKKIVYKNTEFDVAEENVEEFLQELEVDLSLYEMVFDEETLYITSISGTKGAYDEDEDDEEDEGTMIFEVPGIFKVVDELALGLISKTKQKPRYTFVDGELKYSSAVLTPFAQSELSKFGVVIDEYTSVENQIKLGRRLEKYILGIIRGETPEFVFSDIVEIKTEDKPTKKTSAKKTQEKSKAKTTSSEKQPVKNKSDEKTKQKTTAKIVTPKTNSTSKEVMKFITVKEYASIVGLDPSTVSKHFRKGKIEGYYDDNRRIMLLNPNWK